MRKLFASDISPFNYLDFSSARHNALDRHQFANMWGFDVTNSNGGIARFWHVERNLKAAHQLRREAFIAWTILKNKR